MPNYFFTDTRGQVRGPIDDNQLRALVGRGVITPDTPLETGGRKGYARQVPGLFNTSPPQPVVPEVKKTMPIPQNTPTRRTGINENLLVVTIVGVLALLMISGFMLLNANAGRVQAARTAEQERIEREHAALVNTSIATAQQEQKKLGNAIASAEREQNTLEDVIIKAEREQEKFHGAIIANAKQGQEGLAAAIAVSKQEQSRIAFAIVNAEREQTKIQDAIIARVKQTQEKLEAAIVRARREQTVIAQAEQDWLAAERAERERIERERVEREQREREQREREEQERRLAAEQERQRLAEQRRIADEQERRRAFIRAYDFIMTRNLHEEARGVSRRRSSTEREVIDLLRPIAGEFEVRSDSVRETSHFRTLRWSLGGAWIEVEFLNGEAIGRSRSGS